MIKKENFNTISSLSKISSFYNPEKYAILDSRVTTTLNWLIFKYSDKKIFFPIIQGRNKKLQNVFYLRKILKSKDFFDKSKAYFEYIKIIKKISKEIFSTEKLYFAEMFLFTLADTFIINDIKNSSTNP